eukprot:3220631-Prymnesium_polylepis.1
MLHRAIRPMCRPVRGVQDDEPLARGSHPRSVRRRGGRRELREGLERRREQCGSVRRAAPKPRLLQPDALAKGKIVAVTILIRGMYRKRKW